MTGPNVLRLIDRVKDSREPFPLTSHKPFEAPTTVKKSPIEVEDEGLKRRQTAHAESLSWGRWAVHRRGRRVPDHHDSGGRTRQRKLHRRLHGRWHVRTGDPPEAEAREEPLGCRRQQVNRRRPALSREVQSGSYNLVSEPAPSERLFDGYRPEQRSV